MKRVFHSAKPSRPQRGFTAIELMIVVAILGILAALAAPSFTETVKRYRVTSVRDDMTAAIQWARSEAIRRRVQVGFVRTATCAAPLATVDDWDCGWDAFIDANRSGAFDAGDTLLRTFTVPTGLHLTHRAAVASDVMLINQFGQPGTASERFVITPAEGTAFVDTRTVCFFPGGRVYTAKKGDPKCLET